MQVVGYAETSVPIYRTEPFLYRFVHWNLGDKGMGDDIKSEKLND